MRSKGFDLWLLVPAGLLMALGTVIVFTSSAYLASVKGLPEWAYFARHVARLALALVVLVAVSLTPTKFWKEHRAKIFWATVGLLALLLVLGKTVYGARRWISLGFFAFQPSDLAKLALVIYLAGYVAERKRRITEFLSGFLPGLGAIAILAGLIFLEPDVSTSSLLALVGVAILFVGGVKPGQVVLLGALSLGFLAAGVRLFPHARKRLEAFLEGASSQVTQAKIGLAEGGLFGVGPGRGKEKFLYLPKPHTDFAMAVVGEELGLLGSLGVLGLLMVIVLRGLRIASEALLRDPFRGLLATGAALILGVYGLAHASVVVGMLPPTGLPFPFVSYGGSALLANSAALGLLLAVSKEVT